MFTNKWHMNRFGLIDFWYYVNEEFYFKNGHMLLRGSNGSGKSVTMQSFIPLLLDGNKSSERLDPFGTKSRKLENYLIEEDSNRDDRIGYLYLEFKREDVEIYKTIGIGLHARKNKPLDSWYFVIEDNRRINIDLQFMEKNLAITKNVCKNMLQNQFIDTQREYMNRVNQALFGFPSLEDYKETIDLLLQVRSPKLSNSLKPTILNETLNTSLQPLSDEDLRPMTEAIQNMDGIKDQLTSLQESCDSSQVIERVFSQYNYSVLKQKAVLYLNEKNEYDQISKNKRSNEKEIKNLEKQQEENKYYLNELLQETIVLDEQKSSLSKNDGIQIAEEICKLEKAINENQGILNQKIQKQENKNIDLIQAKNDCDKYQKLCDKNEMYIHEIFEELEEIQEEIQLIEHPFIKNEVMNQLNQYYDYSYTQDTIQKELEILTFGKDKFKDLQQFINTQNHWIDLFEKESENKEIKEKELNRYTELFSECVDETIQNFYSWNEKNQFVKCSNNKMQQITDYLQNYYENNQYNEIEKIIKKIYFDEKQKNIEKEVKLNHEKENLEKTCNELNQLYLEWANKVDPTPMLDDYGIQNRKYLKENNIQFIPFYTLLEFDINMSQNEKNRIEEMLERMGLLNALVVSEKDRELVLNHVDGLADSYLFTSCLIDDLNTYWIENFDIHDIFDKLLIKNTNFISNEYYFEMNHLVGTISAKEESKFIGKESRRIYREQKLNEYKTKIDELNQLIQNMNEKLLQIQTQHHQIENEWKSYPKEDDLHLAKSTCLDLEKEIDESNHRISSYEKEINEVDSKIILVKKEINEIAQKCRISAVKEKFESQYNQISKYLNLLNRFIEKQQNYMSQCELSLNSNVRKEQLESDLDDLDYEIHQMKTNIKNSEMIISSKKQQLDEMGFSDIQNKLKQINIRLDELQSEIDKTKEQSARNSQNIITLTNQIENIKITEENQMLKLKKVSDGYFDECKLGYVSFEDVPFENVQEVIKIMDKMMPTLKRKDVLESELQKSFYEHRSNLQEYNLNLESVFSDSFDTMRLNISARYKGKKVTFTQLVEFLKSSIETQKMLLADSERELIEDILVNTISQKIRVHIQNSKHWVENMNKYMSQMSTSSTMKLSLLWKSQKAENEDELNSEKLVELLTKDSKLLKDADRIKLSNHFRSKIETARKLSNLDEVNESFHVIMKKVMDYRTWFEFKIMLEKANEKKRELTNNIFFQLSGGEKAMSMYIPLFSAVAAKFEGARKDSPILIALDEAFAGVDEKNIDNMFGLIEKFKFDYIMNSQVLWGDYASVHSLNIHELVRPENAKYVAVISYTWNGNEKVLIPS